MTTVTENDAGLAGLVGALRRYIAGSLAAMGARIDALQAQAAVPGSQGPAGEKGAVGDRGRDGLEGTPGRDAAAIEVADGIDAERRYARGTFAAYRGGLVRSFRVTDPLGSADSVERAGWQIVLDGDAEDTIEQAEDLRTFTLRRVKTSGRIVEKTVTLPAVIYRGVWVQRAYAVGDCVTKDGCGWIALQPTDELPGVSAAWQMAIRKGRDGRDGARGEKGERGERGKAGADLTQMGPDGKKW